jgi:hypothetical protein
MRESDGQEVGGQNPHAKGEPRPCFRHTYASAIQLFSKNEPKIARVSIPPQSVMKHSPSKCR